MYLPYYYYYLPRSYEPLINQYQQHFVYYPVIPYNHYYPLSNDPLGNERQTLYLQVPDEVEQAPEAVPPNFNIQKDLPWNTIQSQIKSQYIDYAGTIQCQIMNNSVRCVLFSVPNIPEFKIGTCTKTITRKIFGQKIKIKVSYWCLQRRKSRFVMYIQVGTKGIPSLNLKKRIQECIMQTKKSAENAAYSTFLTKLPLGLQVAASEAISAAFSAAISTFKTCMIGIATDLEKILEDVQNVEYYRNLIKNLKLSFPYEQIDRTNWEPFNWRLPSYAL
ncbi:MULTISPECIES: hypothetical protein [Bacillus]|uniref:hypothetical protein n=1 Tax=Bacillus TaxID=1386 RepID=UPI000CDAB630|nr:MULTISPECIES: hypothetical protein [Bacillus]POO79637.1 hypothetical protein C1T30_24920 [Bacillus sp. MBGLi97]AUZ37375.1 hypothetical protein C1T29_03275 [Bacillus sp. MBGLi79]MDG3075187.1 hypothetical protein [Bacillus halotolerans]RJS51493.1 hypothetical protein CJ480_06630 [Bacillus subtilis]UQZ54554.1 hypothetical protein C2H96_08500 [Bacillus subtilis]